MIEHFCCMAPNATKCWSSPRLSSTESIASLTPTTSVFMGCDRENGTVTASASSVARRLSAPVTLWAIVSLGMLPQSPHVCHLNQLVVIDPFAGSCNTLFWILRRLPNSEGIAFESDLQVFEVTHRNLAVLGQRIELVHGDYVRLLEERRVQEDRGIVTFVAPPWGTALDEVRGLNLSRTTPPISEVIDQVACRFPKHRMLFATQVYEKISAPSLNQIQTRLDWSELRSYAINEAGRNHGVLLGTKGWAPRWMAR